MGRYLYHTDFYLFDFGIRGLYTGKTQLECLVLLSASTRLHLRRLGPTYPWKVDYLLERGKPPRKLR